MQVALTGGTGFVGRYILSQLVSSGHQCRVWHREQSDRGGLEDLRDSIAWVPGNLTDTGSMDQLVEGCQAVVHAALEYRPTGSFLSRAFDNEMAVLNIQGTLQLIEAARSAGVGRFVFISSCAVYHKILSDRPLDETHPLWPNSDYGAHKAAIEAFVHSYAQGEGFSICALRPTGVYGAAHPIEDSKWYDLVRAVVRGEEVACSRGGKEVHASDVAQAVETLLHAQGVAGEAYNCYDRYISEYDVATLAKTFTGSNSMIHGSQTQPKNQIDTTKIRGLGVQFGGEALLEETIRYMIQAVRAKESVEA